MPNPTKHFSIWLNYRSSTIAVFIISLCLFTAIMVLDINTDIQLHIDLLARYLKNGFIPIPPLYFLLLHFLSLFSLSAQSLIIASVIILSASITFKFICTNILISSINPGYTGNYFNIGKIKLPYYGIVGTLLLAHPIAILGLNHMYLGRIPISVWHNSTTIALTPFALLLFYYSYQYTLLGKREEIIKILLLSIINILIKPSFFFVFIVSFPIFLFAVNRKLIRKHFVLLAISGILSILVLLTEYYFIYKLNILDEVYYQGNTSKVVFAPFVVWEMYSKTKFLDLLVSISFPITVLIYYRKTSIVKNSILFYAVLIFTISMLIMILFAEDGPRIHHFNFIWQAIVSNYILFVVCMALWMKIVSSKEVIGFREYITLSIFLLHVISGVLYLYKILATNSYV